MKKLLFILVFVTMLVSTSYAEQSLTMTSYYPAPSGAYKSIQLSPQATITPSTGCVEGTMYYDSTEQAFKACQYDTSLATTSFAVAQGVFTQDNDGSIFLTQQPANPKLSLVGTADPTTKFIWNAEKNALRAGQVDGTQWDEANLGDFSVAFGINNKVSDGTSSILGGSDNTISTGGYADNSTIAAGSNNSVVGEDVGKVFIGAGNNNHAGGYASFIGAGDSNNVGSDESHAAFVGAGRNNWADGESTFIGAGWNNEADGDEGFIGAGISNNVSGTAAFIGSGNGNIVNSDYSVIGGGTSNTANGPYSFVGGGDTNTASGDSSFVGGGARSTASGQQAYVGGGESNIAEGLLAFVGNGQYNDAAGDRSAIVSGMDNVTTGEYSFVGGGLQNTAAGAHSFVGGGRQSVANGNYSFVGGGGDDDNVAWNVAQGASSSVVGGIENYANGDASFVGGGHLNKANGVNSFVGGGGWDPIWRQAGNTADETGASVVGGTGNHATAPLSFVGGGSSNTTQAVTDGQNSVVVGGKLNSVGGQSAFIGGGENNIINGMLATITGGKSNDNEGEYGFIGGGQSNAVNHSFGFLGGGVSNMVGDPGSGGLTEGAVVAGGGSNQATGNYSAILGGAYNQATGPLSMIPGGEDNIAGGWYSFAAGFNMNVNADYTFAYGYSPVAVDISTPNAFIIYTSKVGIGVANPTHLLQLAGGAYSDGVSWQPASSRELKKDIASISSKDAIDTVMQLDPVSFHYKELKDDHLRMGFIAEDVPDAVASTGRKSLDPMNFIAILTKTVQEQQKMIDKQQKEIEELKTKIK